jgi:predicted transposase YbfD/YdcC
MLTSGKTGESSLFSVQLMSQGFAPAVVLTTPRVVPLEISALSQGLVDCFKSVEDPRVERGQLHLLSDILIIAILSTLAGGNGWESMELYGSSKEAWLSTFLALPNGIPSPDTFRRVIECIHPKQMEQSFEQWVRTLVTDLGVQVIAIDGKKLRGSYDRNNRKQCLYLVSAWAADHRLVLGQTKVQDKSNEITAVPALLELLDISGCIVTLDAMGTQKTIAAQIQAAKADYILCLKANHPTLFNQVKLWFETSRSENTLPKSAEYKVESGHHRIERRQVWTIPLSALPELHEADGWVGLRTIVIVERTRQLWNKTTHEVQFYLTSLEAENPRIGSAIRQHWGIENSQHWVLDVTFGEDACRVRSLNGPENLAVLRRFALNALNRETTGKKRSLVQKTRLAGMSDDYMVKVLVAALPELSQSSSPTT